MKIPIPILSGACMKHYFPGDSFKGLTGAKDLIYQKCQAPTPIGESYRLSNNEKNAKLHIIASVQFIALHSPISNFDA